MTPDWDLLARDHPQGLVDTLRAAYEQGSISFTAAELADAASTLDETYDEDEALALMRAAGPWLEERTRALSPDPEFPDEAPPSIPIFTWIGPQRSRLGWLVLVHGMNTRGDWQQYLAFDVGRWCGTSVPTFIHKYGRIIVGVILPWRRRKFARDLKKRLVELSKQATEERLPEAPDVVAHSFGTWMLGHVLLDQMARGEPYDVKVGRVILTGSILRPDFPWERLQQAGLVEDVLNHYATNDPVVPWAHWTIVDSGPSGRRGFDPPATPHDHLEVINVQALPEGHSGALSDEQRYGNYSATWVPFLTNPPGGAATGVEVEIPEKKWRQAWWPLRGTLLPTVAVPLLGVLLAWGLAALGPSLTSLRESWADALAGTAGGLGLAAAGLVGLFGLHALWRRITKSG